MIDAFKLYNKVCGAVNTHQGGMIKPNRQFIDWVNDTSKQLLEEKFIVFQKTQKITDDLSPFLRSLPVKVETGGPTYDLVKFPSEYGHVASIRFYHKNFKEVPEVKCKNPDPFKNDDFSYDVPESVDEQNIDIIDNARWGAIFKHKTKKPRFDKPYANQHDGGFKIAPKGIAFVVIDFFRVPKDATFLYTLGSGDQIIYNPSSQPLEWPELTINEFIDRAKKKYGMFTRDPALYQWADKEIATNV